MKWFVRYRMQQHSSRLAACHAFASQTLLFSYFHLSGIEFCRFVRFTTIRPSFIVYFSSSSAPTSIPRTNRYQCNCLWSGVVIVFRETVALLHAHSSSAYSGYVFDISSCAHVGIAFVRHSNKVMREFVLPSRITMFVYRFFFVRNLYQCVT